jgi:hypothetical protein
MAFVIISKLLDIEKFFPRRFYQVRNPWDPTVRKYFSVTLGTSSSRKKQLGAIRHQMMLRCSWKPGRRQMTATLFPALGFTVLEFYERHK